MQQKLPNRVLVATMSQSATGALPMALPETEFSVELAPANDTEVLLDRVNNFRPEIVLLELEDSTSALAALRSEEKHLPILAVLREAKAELAFAASKAGADGLLTLPASAEEIRDGVLNCLRIPVEMQVEPDNESAKRKGPDGLPALFGSHPRMAEIRDTIARVATTSATVLIRGESGVGKDIVSRMIYERSRRSERPFVKVNCAAIPDELLESELFGYEAGAFTGAVKAKPGKFELAHTGTLFLDEIGEMQPALQAKLLHVLQDGQFSRLGAKRDAKVDVRVLCATNKLLEQRVTEGLFREDLYYRINVVTVHIPPLRERRDEIPLLVQFFLDKYARAYGRDPVAFSREGIAGLLRYSWPGNIRELENLCKRFVIVGGETQILRELAQRGMAPAKAEVALAEPESVKPVIGSNEVIEKKSLDLLEVGRKAAWQAEKTLILETLEETRWNRKEAARRLQISYRALRNKIGQIDADRLQIAL